MRRLLILFAASLHLWTVVMLVNDALSSRQIYLFAGALFVTYAALSQPLRPGLFASLLAGLVCDAQAPVTFGTHLLLFAAAHLILFHVRERVPREDTISVVAVVLVVNLALFLVFSLTQIHAVPVASALWPRLVVDLICSQIFVGLITPWFFSLQSAALAMAQVRRDDPA